MSKKTKLYIILISVTILGIVALEMSKPKAINWFPSYALHHKIPLGSYIFNEQLSEINNKVVPLDRPPFEYLKQHDIEGTYLFYNGGISFGKDELNSLLSWVEKGNTLMVAAENFETALLDTLNLKTERLNPLDNFNNEYQVQLVHPALNPEKTYRYDRPNEFYYFSEIDTLKTTVIGLIDTYREDHPPLKDALISGIKQPFGKGKIILSTFPQGFTNYFILKSPNASYTAGLLSYIDQNRSVYIDTYYKNGKTFYTSPMYLFLNTPSLKWAYYLVLIGALIYIIFEGKRKQRAIPIITPLKNQTLSFTRTIANMYYESEKHKTLSEHQIQHFLEYIRTTLHLPTSEINSTFIKHLAARSNNSIEDTKTLFACIETLTHKPQISATELKRLHTLIAQFKSHNQWKKKRT
ncbi:DUF4350 domain-containing protein [Winogradskyella arenosi]|uniref:Uncharacterized protein DUF4350 n=1 Tax=Winogradskyella arenosi TaxID=533325 RepID=A0A368ZFN8_9FLAO|nr:DUF4350 domain-containing protein [Winogradskyella arenosi]RCW92344.1 uncharacterized protein DUF4350 [Winogradskyella arenosi]